jgi:hypothetical protein
MRTMAGLIPNSDHENSQKHTHTHTHTHTHVQNKNPTRFYYKEITKKKTRL